jgi:hypothetical protein
MGTNRAQIECKYCNSAKSTNYEPIRTSNAAKKPLKIDYRQRRLILTDTTNAELENARGIRDSINAVFQKKLNIAKSVIAGIGKSQYNRNIVLIITEEFDATLLQNPEEILEKFFQFKSSKIDAKWHKFLIYDVPIAEFLSNNGMELL